ncbi:MAG: LysR family transcriptional regulator [Alphaproteobacteria bacterium]|nr:LysR family transcriptional regulator [Alphaproteobacteria bacterium]
MRLPPLLGLQAFDAVGRLGSFKAAAAELGLTPSAVSHRIAQLEQALGLKLFERRPREATLTRAGAQYGIRVRQAFDELQAASRELARRHGDGVLRVSAPPMVASLVLMPGLEEFLARHPDIELSLSTSTMVTDLAREEVDVAIRIGQGPWPGVHAHSLSPIAILPVAAPRLLARTPLARVEDLARHTLIHSASAPDLWAQWLAGRGLPTLKPRRNLHLDGIGPALDAAERGLGVALGILPFAQPLIEAGRLVQPFPPVRPKDYACWLVCRKGEERRRKIVLFRRWLAQRLSTDG